MEGSEGWERIPYFFAAAGDIQAKPTRVSGGLDLLVYIFIQEPFEVFSSTDPSKRYTELFGIVVGIKRRSPIFNTSFPV